LGPVRRQFRRSINRRSPGELNGLFKALVLGDRTGLEPRQRETFARTGTAHLLAISGLHVGLVAGLVLAGVRRCLRALLWALHPEWAEGGRGDWLPWLAAILAATFYVVVAGSPVSGRRALFMLVLYLVASGSRRGVSGWNVLGGAAGLVLLVDPMDLTSPALHLSLVSVAGLLLLPRRDVQDQGVYNRLGGVVRSGLSASLLTGLATAPLCALLWGRVPVAGLWLNGPLIALLGTVTVPALLAGCLFAVIHESLSVPLFAVATLASSLGLRLVDGASSPSWSPIVYWQPDVLWVAGLYAALGLTLLAIRLRPGRRDKSDEPLIQRGMSLPASAVASTTTGTP